MKKLCKDFLKCGILGWCLEILVSGAEALRRQDKTLTCHTSLWMFPIYGLSDRPRLPDFKAFAKNRARADLYDRHFFRRVRHRAFSG